MLTAYIERAMSLAQFEPLEDRTFYGSIAGFQGVWANAKSLAQCYHELRDVLEGWILLQVADHTSLPPINGITLDIGTPA